MGCCGKGSGGGKRGRSRLINKKRMAVLKKEREEMIKKAKKEEK